HVRFPLRGERRRHADDDAIQLRDGLEAVGGLKLSRLDQPLQRRRGDLPDRAFATLQALHPARVHVDAGDLKSPPRRRRWRAAGPRSPCPPRQRAPPWPGSVPATAPWAPSFTVLLFVKK